jgi:hypothetical protein
MPFGARETTQSYVDAGPSSISIKGSYPLQKRENKPYFRRKNIIIRVFCLFSFILMSSGYFLGKARHGGVLAENLGLVQL